MGNTRADTVSSPSGSAFSEGLPLPDAVEQWLRRTPMAAPAVGLVAGLIGGELAPWPVWLSVAVVLAGGVGVFLARRRYAVASLCVWASAAGAGAALHDALLRRIPDDHLVRLVGGERQLARVVGTVASTPIVSSPPPAPFKDWLSHIKQTRFLLACKRMEAADGWHDVSGLAQVKVDEAVLTLRSGEGAELFGWLHRFRPPANPGQFDWAARQARRGVHVGISCEHAATVRSLGSPGVWSWAGVIGRLRHWARACVLGDVLPDDPAAASLIEGLLLGQRSRIDREVNEAFVRTGTSHFLAVSGAHVAILSLSLWGVLTFAGLSQRQTAVVVMAAIILFGLIVEPRAPAVRAVIITVTFCLSVLFRRSVATGNWIAMSAVIILALRPNELFEPGFQLSFGVLIGIIVLHRPIRGWIDRWVLRRDPLAERLTEQTERGHWSVDLLRRIGDWTLWVLCGSLAAWSVSLPIAAYHFQRVSLWGWLATPVLFPFVCVAMWAGLAKAFVSLLWPSVGSLIASVLGGPAVALRWAATGLAGLPTVSWQVAAPPLWWLAVYFATVTLALCRHRARLLAWPLALSVLVLAGGAAARWLPLGGQRDALRVRVLAVGPGSAVLIELPNGRNLLYDAGSLAAHNVGASVVVPALYHDGVARIDELIISHPNLDHYSATPSIHDAARIRRLVLNEHFEPLAAGSQTARRFLDLMRDAEIPVETVRAGHVLADTGEGRCEVLWPPKYADSAGLSVNDSSTVLRLAFGGVRILMCGDITEQPQRSLLASGRDLSADVLILPHHGAVAATTADFLAAVGAAYVVRSSGHGLDRTAPELLELVEGTHYFNTADDGAVTITVARDGKLSVSGHLNSAWGRSPGAAP